MPISFQAYSTWNIGMYIFTISTDYVSATFLFSFPYVQSSALHKKQLKTMPQSFQLVAQAKNCSHPWLLSFSHLHLQSVKQDCWWLQLQNKSESDHLLPALLPSLAFTSLWSPCLPLTQSIVKTTVSISSYKKSAPISSSQNPPMAPYSFLAKGRVFTVSYKALGFAFPYPSLTAAPTAHCP